MSDFSVIQYIRAFLTSSPVTAAVLICISIILILTAFALGRAFGKLETERTQDKLIRSQRKDAVRRSRAVIGGQVSEQLAPFLPDFPCDPGDVRFIGKPIDFIGFIGSAADKPIEEILFIEVKTGNAGLTKREKEIKEAIQKKRVRYIEYRTD